VKDRSLRRFLNILLVVALQVVLVPAAADVSDRGDPNMPRDWLSRVSTAGIDVTSRSGESWNVRLSLSAFGREGAFEPVAPSIPVAVKSRFELRRGPVTEWYLDTAKGVEQGFTIAARPGPDDSELPVIIEMEYSGGLGADISEHGQAITFRGPKGAPVLRYADLHVHDADARELEARFTLSPGHIRIRIHDAGAAYPLTVDPLITSPAWTAESNRENADYGRCVATAGDVNGDGFSDVIIGAPGYDNGEAGEGAVYVYHGSASGLCSDPAWSAESNQAGALFGSCVATAGDINGDGFSDIVVGARGYSNGELSEGRAYVYHGSASGLSSIPAWTREGNQVDACFGCSVAAAGDVNGDGYCDVVVGAQNYDNGEIDEGMAYVYHGSASGLSPTAAWTAESNQSGGMFGDSVATAGDVNGDGYADVIVGARGYSNGELSEGRAYVYHGSASGLLSTGTWTAESHSVDAGFGWSVSTAGDVNGDGFSDVIIGASTCSNGEVGEGRAYVYHGSTSGLSFVPTWIVESNQADAMAGSSVATAGDVNGDGYCDVVVGATYYTNDDIMEGQVFVYLGSASGLSSTESWTAESNQTLSLFGASVATAGDVNADGFSDVIVGAPTYDNGEDNEGRAFAFLGSGGGLSAAEAWTAEGNRDHAALGESVATAGDVNGDGFSDVIVGAPWYGLETSGGRVYVFHGSTSGLSSTPASTLEGEQMWADFGDTVATAGDVNGDGFSDVIVGAVNFDNGEENEGRVYVYHGSPSGLCPVAAWIAESHQPESGFGASAAAAGDVNGDGFSDIIVGAFSYDNGETDEGRVWVFHGSVSGLSLTAAWIAEGGQNDAAFGCSVATAGDVNGDGFSDVIIGAARYSNDQPREGRVFAYHGSASGLSADPSWIAESNRIVTGFGVWVGTAGDVNGDGFSDVIVGACDYSNGQNEEGRAYLFHGSASGLSMTEAWTAEGDQADAYFGDQVATAGDVNGDGFSDVIVGAPFYGNDDWAEGRVFAYLGSASGVSSTPDWIAEGNQETACFGWSLGTAGDVNGDGFSDVIVGAHGYDNGEDYEGRVFLYYGNGGAGLDRIPRQARADRSALIDLLGRAWQDEGFLVRANGRSPFGRDKVKLEWEVKPLGVPYNLADVKRSGWFDTGEPGAGGSFVPLEQPETSLPVLGPYKWRLRLRSRFPYPWQSHWMSLPYNCITETDLRASVPVLELVATKTMTDTNRGDLQAGDSVNFQIDVEPLGNVPATNVVVVEVVDPSIEDLVAPTGVMTGSTILWHRGSDSRLASIAPDVSVALQFTGTVRCEVADGTPICNEDTDWSVLMDGPGDITKNSPDCLTVRIPDFSVSTKEIDPASLPATGGSTIHYQLQVCNQGSGTGTNVTVTDTLDTTLDETTINAPGAVVAGNVITWTIATLGPGAIGTPTCQALEFWVNVKAGVPMGAQICNEAHVTSDEWFACGRDFRTGEACFTPGSSNELLREWCATLSPPCDLAAIWNPDLDPYPLGLTGPPGSIDDPETGILTNSARPLVFYEVTEPPGSNTVRCTKKPAAETVTISY
jgi:uncharacterized repeat protein (TIGR01451 family)